MKHHERTHLNIEVVGNDERTKVTENDEEGYESAKHQSHCA